MAHFLLKLYLAKYFINFDFIFLASLFVLLENGFTECRFLFERIFSKENCALEDCGWSSPRPEYSCGLIVLNFCSKQNALKAHMHFPCAGTWDSHPPSLHNQLAFEVICFPPAHCTSFLVQAECWCSGAGGVSCPSPGWFLTLRQLIWAIGMCEL